MKINQYLNSRQKFLIQDQDGNTLSYPAYLEGVATFYPDNPEHVDHKEAYSFFDTPEKVSKSCSYFIPDHHDILMVDTQHHPEQRWDELYFGNVVNPFSDDPYRYRNFELDRIGWKCKRYGKIAYSTGGEIIEDMVPLFVERREIENAIESEKYRIDLYGDKAYGSADNIRVWQNMLDRGTVF